MSEMPATVLGNLTPVNRGSITRDVAARLLEYLSAASLAPGARLPSERQLAEALQVGRSAIRETLAALEVLGIIDSRPGSGSYLRQQSSDLLPTVINWGLTIGQSRTLDLVEARSELEVITARLAAQRAADPDIRKLTEHLDRMRRSRSSLGGFIEADVAFHLEIADIARNTVLGDMLHSIRSLLQVWIERAVSAEGSTKNTIAEHEAILAAIAARDPDQAHEAMHTHMHSAGERLKRSLHRASESATED